MKSFRFHDYRNNEVTSGILEIDEICKKIEDEKYKDHEFLVTEVVISNETYSIDVDLSKYRYKKKEENKKEKEKKAIENDKDKKVSSNRKRVHNENRADVVSVGI